MPFIKGQSGNPGGRPKEDAEVRELARQYSSEALNRLLDWMRADNPKASVSACQAILDRAYGKPGQAVQHTGLDEGPIEHAVQVAYVGPDPTPR